MNQSLIAYRQKSHSKPSEKLHAVIRMTLQVTGKLLAMSSWAPPREASHVALVSPACRLTVRVGRHSPMACLLSAVCCLLSVCGRSAAVGRGLELSVRHPQLAGEHWPSAETGARRRRRRRRPGPRRQRSRHPPPLLPRTATSPCTQTTVIKSNDRANRPQSLLAISGN